MSVTFSFHWRVVFVLFSFISITYSAAADAPFYYLIHARLELKNNVVKTGYFALTTDRLLIARDKAGYCYYSVKNGHLMRLHPVDSSANGWHPAEIDYHFNHELLYSMNDSTLLFNNAKVIDFLITQGNEIVHAPRVAMLGSPAKIGKNEVVSVSVESILLVSSYANAKLTFEDESWIKSRAAFQESVGGYEICDFEAVGFQKAGPTTKALLEELRRLFKDYTRIFETEGYEKFDLRQRGIIEKLRQEHVLIFSFCSC
jgi:hypothetical protein